MFEDEAFSKTRLKSCFLFSFGLPWFTMWSTLLLEIFSVFLSTVFVGCFFFFANLILLIFLGFGLRLLSVYALYTPRGPCSFFWYIYMYVCIYIYIYIYIYITVYPLKKILKIKF